MNTGERPAPTARPLLTLAGTVCLPLLLAAAPCRARAQDLPKSVPLTLNRKVEPPPGQTVSSPLATPIASPVADAAANDDIDAIKKLLARHADVNVAQGDGMTALHWAAEYNDPQLTDLLLKAGAKVGATTLNAGYTPLHIASRAGAGPVVVALLKAGADPKAVTNSGATPLHLAAASGNVQAVTALLDKGADPNARENEWQQTPLIFAANENRGDAIRVLIAHGANPALRSKAADLKQVGAEDQAAQRARNAAAAALRAGLSADSAAKLAEVAAATAPAAGAAAAGRGGRGGGGGAGGGRGGGGGGGGGRGGGAPAGPPLTPDQLQESIEAGRQVILKNIQVSSSTYKEEVDTANGAQAGFVNQAGGLGGFTPLHIAARDGSLSALKALLDGGADVNARSTNDSTTPLLQAAINGQFDAEMLLLQYHADPNLASSINGVAPLWATENQAWDMRSIYPQQQAMQYQKTSYLDVEEALLKAGAKVDAVIKSQPFYFTYSNCGDGNCGLVNVGGTTAFWRAAFSVDLDAMRLLVKYGANANLAQAAGAGRGGRGGGGGGGGRGGGFGGGGAGFGGGAGAGAGAGRAAAGDSSGLNGALAAAVAGQGRGGGRAGGRGGGGGGGGRGGGVPVDPAVTAALAAVPRGPGALPIHCAAGVGYGLSVGAGNSHRYVPDGWLPAMKFLVEEMHADVNARDASGYTPLHYAAARGDNEMIKYLVSKGADVKAVAAGSGELVTTVDMANGPSARIAPYPATIALLESLGATNSHHCKSC